MTKIMLVEDDKSLREIYSIRLAAEGYDIVSAGDGEEGLATAVKEKPDLIIADVMMPKISGFDMLDILRSQPETNQIKVIVMTALSSEDQRQRGEALGASKYLVKSQVGIEDVIDAVHEVLGDAPNSNAQANIVTAKAVGEIEKADNATKLASPVPPAQPVPTPAPVAQNPGNVATSTKPPVAGAIENADTLAQSTATMQKQGIAPNTDEVLQKANIQESVRKMYEDLQKQQAERQAKVASAPAPAPAPATAQPAPVQPTPAPAPVTPAPAPAPVPPKNAGMTSRVIQPMHDVTTDERDSIMQKQMAEILGDDGGDARPTAVSSKDVPEPTPAPAPEATESKAPSIPPPPVPPVVEAPKTEAMPMPPTEEITKDTPIPTVDEIADPGIPQTVKPAQPGYLSNLAEELSDDAQGGDAPAPNSMAEQMKAELSDTPDAVANAQNATK